jgi:hypothetical protein
MSNHQVSHHSPPVEDDGYTRICGICATRWGNVPFLSGREREVKMEPCKTCADNPTLKLDSFQLRDRTRKRR